MGKSITLASWWIFSVCKCYFYWTTILTYCCLIAAGYSHTRQLILLMKNQPVTRGIPSGDSAHYLWQTPAVQVNIKEAKDAEFFIHSLLEIPSEPFDFFLSVHSEIKWLIRKYVNFSNSVLSFNKNHHHQQHHLQINTMQPLSFKLLFSLSEIQAPSQVHRELLEDSYTIQNVKLGIKLVRTVR